MAKRTKSRRERDRLEWWEEARFGMFIHWGLYAIPAGKWKGEEIPGIGEWIMCRAKIPVPEYEKLAEKFNPTKFDADAWVKLAKEAGMKYLVITAKHHDGFAMFDSPASDYDIVDATPYGKDPMKALAKACKKAGIKLCFYYSQAQDWHHPDAAGNTWYYTDESKKRFGRYLKEKVKPQLHELLTQYGDIGLIWFDTPQKITRAQSLELKRYVHRLQPDCLVSGRVGHEVGDYQSMGDNQIPAGPVEGYWETPATMNDTWGYKKNDRNWKSVKTLLQLLVDLASKGVNYLLNVGPTAKGVIPDPSVRRLKAIGEWMDVNGGAIYGTEASPWPWEFEWGRVTCKPDRVFLHFFNWPRGKFQLTGLKNEVRRAYLMADKKQKVEVDQEYDEALELHSLELNLPRKKPDKNVAVVVLEVEGEPEVDDFLIQHADGSVPLPAYMAELHLPKQGRQIRLGRNGAIENWFSKSNWVSWEFKVLDPGTFELKVLTTAPRWQEWKGGHVVRVSVGGMALEGPLTADEEVDKPRAQYFPETSSSLGKVDLPQPGTYELKLRARDINKDDPSGLCLTAVRLERC